MTEITHFSIYANLVAIIICIGVSALALRLKMHDAMEKRIFLSLMAVIALMAVFYMLCEFVEVDEYGVSATGAKVVETILEIILNLFALIWMIYVDYRVFHSRLHLRRNRLLFLIPFFVVSGFFVIDIFTGILSYYDENLVFHENVLYTILDACRYSVFLISFIWLAVQKKKDEKTRFFSVLPMLIPILIYSLFYYFTPYPTPALGFAIGMMLMYAQLINELTFQDAGTGFYNRLYLDYLRELIQKGDYELNGIISFKLPEGELERNASVMTRQLPKACDPIRTGKDTVVTLAHIKNKGGLHLAAEDVEMALAQQDIKVAVKYELRKKKESGAEFLKRFLEADKRGTEK